MRCIEMGAFADCRCLTDITLPDELVAICETAFLNCTGIKSITIPENVETNKYCAFGGWTSSQTINVKGKSEAPAEWKQWDLGCEAKIVWNA